MLPKLQAEMKTWLEYNFPGTTAFEQFAGVVEEVGELAHALLKMSQGIRGSKEELGESERDSVGDIAIYLMNYCNMRGFDFEKILATTWERKVSKRDWRKYPGNGQADDPPVRDEVADKIVAAAIEYVTADLAMENFDNHPSAQLSSEYSQAETRTYQAYQNLVDIISGVIE